MLFKSQLNVVFILMYSFSMATVSNYKKFLFSLSRGQKFQIKISEVKPLSLLSFLHLWLQYYNLCLVVTVLPPLASVKMPPLLFACSFVALYNDQVSHMFVCGALWRLHNLIAMLACMLDVGHIPDHSASTFFFFWFVVHSPDYTKKSSLYSHPDESPSRMGFGGPRDSTAVASLPCTQSFQNGRWFHF